jgi:hypothetical protein
MDDTLFFDEMKVQIEFLAKVRRKLSSELGVTFEVRLVNRKAADGSAAGPRVVDLRRG